MSGGFVDLGSQKPDIPILIKNLCDASWPWWLVGTLAGKGDMEH